MSIYKRTLICLIVGGLENFLDVAGYLDTTPFFHQFSIPVDQESAAFDTAPRLAVTNLGFHDVEAIADGFFRIGNQGKRQIELFRKIFMRTHTVTGKADNLGIGLQKFRIIFPEIDAFGCTARCIVFGIEIDDEVFTLVVRQFEWLDGCFAVKSGTIWSS